MSARQIAVQPRGQDGRDCHMRPEIEGTRPHLHQASDASINLVLIPTQMASGPLAEWLGYETWFVFVMIVSIPSVIVARRAPFPNGNKQ